MCYKSVAVTSKQRVLPASLQLYVSLTSVTLDRYVFSGLMEYFFVPNFEYDYNSGLSFE